MLYIYIIYMGSKRNMKKNNTISSSTTLYNYKIHFMNYIFMSTVDLSVKMLLNIYVNIYNILTFKNLIFL